MTRYEWMQNHMRLLLESYFRCLLAWKFDMAAMWLKKYQAIDYEFDELTVEEASEVIYERLEE